MLLCVKEHTMEYLRNYKIRNVISMIVNFMDNKLRDYLSNNIKWDRYVRKNATNATILNTHTEAEALISAKKVKKRERERSCDPSLSVTNSIGSFNFTIEIIT